MSAEPPPVHVPELLDAAQLAVKWRGIREDTLRLWARRGDLPSVRIGRRIMFRAADVAAWLERQPSGARGEQ